VVGSFYILPSKLNDIVIPIQKMFATHLEYETRIALRAYKKSEDPLKLYRIPTKFICRILFANWY
jgi:hypothetical protein